MTLLLWFCALSLAALLLRSLVAPAEAVGRYPAPPAAMAASNSSRVALQTGAAILAVALALDAAPAPLPHADPAPAFSDVWSTPSISDGWLL